MQHAPVSVVIPTYNSADLIVEALQSVLAQTAAPAEVIVIDDGSTDATAERLRAYADRIQFRRQPNGGPSSARNHGMRLCTQPFVAFLDADDVWHPRKLERQVKQLIDHPEIGLVATGHIDWPRQHFRQGDVAADERLIPVTWDELCMKATILTSAVMVRRTMLDLAGDFDGSLCGCEDRDMFLRLAEVGRLARIDEALIGYRDSPGSLTKDAVTCERGMRVLLNRLDERRAWHGRRLLRRKAYSFMHHSCASAHARAGNHLGAVIREAKSLASYPLPYRAADVRMRAERLKRLIVNGLRMCRLKRSDAAGLARRVDDTRPVSVSMSGR